DHIDLARLLVGSEGTLAVITEAALRTEPLPAERSMVVLGFANLDTALRASLQAVTTRPSACELLDHRLLTLARTSDESAAAFVPSAAQVVLLVEYEAEAPGEAHDAAVALADWLYRTQRLALHAYTALTDREIERIWALRGAAIESLYRFKGQAQPVPLVEDVG